MEKGQILTIIITVLTSLFGSSVLTAYLNRRWMQSNKAYDILKEQYLNVISPIYREIQLSSVDKEKMITNIGVIIYENFHLLPEQLLEKFRNIGVNEDEFKNLIFDFYILLRNELGYSRIKISKDVKEKEKLLAAKKVMFVIDRLFFNFFALFGFALTAISIFGIYLSSIQKPNNSNYQYVFLTFLLIGLFGCIISIIYFIKTDFGGYKNTSHKKK